MQELRPISVLVRNERGVLSRVSGLFARRGFNITSLAVGETEDPRYSRITVVVGGDDATMEQVVKQLKRLVSVRQVQDLTRSDRVERGLALIKVRADAKTREEIARLVDIFRARIDHVDQHSLIVEVTGRRQKVQAIMDMLRPYGIIEMARTGQIVLGRHRPLLEQQDDRPSPSPSPGDQGEESGIYNLYQSKEG